MSKTFGIVGASFAAGAAVGALAIFLATRPPVGRTGITIRPKNTDHPKFTSHWKDIQGVLKDYPQLYYIEEFSDGKLVQTYGNNCNLLPLAYLEAIHKEASPLQHPPKGYTNYAVQLGIGLGKGTQEASDCLDGSDQDCPQQEGEDSSVEGPDMPQAHYKQYIAESACMVEKINAVLAGAPTPTCTPMNTQK